MAGTAGGGGVTADGTSYTGPYDASTPSTTFKVGPGVAPQVDLYALRVFGCSGSTDVTTEAIDWAVAHDMDVINMSLGSSFGSADDPSAVAASNAVASGVVVVASAGNSGPSPYLTGSPGTGKGVISVAAIDSTESFPAVDLTLAGSRITAINANGAAVPSGPYRIVALSDDPATAENESLGCSPGAFTAAGISADAGAPLQLAEVSRGTCARAGKAVYGQQAGADAVLMINNSGDYPPFEGAITENPDDGTPYTVTIPFLGVRSTDGAAVKAAAGQQTTLAAGTTDNPNFRGLASFSSNGPRTGDSGLKANVSAPGVSIASAAVGTGDGVAIMSGTSMAAPHVAGVAALTKQAHPDWSADDLSAAVVSPADPSKVDGYQLTLAGAGLVDTAQSVSTELVAYGDAVATARGTVHESTLSFGFAEIHDRFSATRTLTVANHGNDDAYVTLSSESAPGAWPGTVSFDRTRVTVPAHDTATVEVELQVEGTDIPSSMNGDDQFRHHQVGGNVVLASSGGRLRVPYLLVPRAETRVTASVTPAISTKTSSVSVNLANSGGPVSTVADFFTWGLSDGDDINEATAGVSGLDLRAAGVQSFPLGDDELVVFAVNNHSRWNNAAVNEFDVNIDKDDDGTPEFVLFSYDSGAVRAGSFNGVTEVFLFDVAAEAISATGFMAEAPTDSSTILLPVYAGDLGLTNAHGRFRYGVASYSLVNPAAMDAMPGLAIYDPWSHALENGHYEPLEYDGSSSVTVGVNRSRLRMQNPKGLMVVAYDNAAGAPEALLIPRA
ncbi:MAG: S8 family serine peptidase [Micropruina sp.]